MSAPLRNWAGNYTYAAGRVVAPRGRDELADIVAGERSLGVLGSRHSFTAIGDGDTLIAWDRYGDAAAIDVDRAAMTVRVGPAVTFAQLAAHLNRAGLALANLASLPHISVAGAVATASHGSGDGVGNLSTLVRGMEILTSGGEVVHLGPGDPRLAGAAVHLGLLGVVLEVTLAVIPFYAMGQTVYAGIGWDTLVDHWDEVFGLGRSVSVFHTLGARTREVWVKADAGQELPRTLFGAARATAASHPVPGGDAAAATPQLGEPGPWSERLPHFRSEFQPSAGAEIQSEWFVERRQAPEALSALLAAAEDLAPVLLVAELRSIAADALWLSPHTGRDSIGLHFTWAREPAGVAANVARIESALAPFAPRPHWGKVFSVSPEALGAAYEAAPAFAALRRELDPRGAFINRWARERVGFLLDAPS